MHFVKHFKGLFDQFIATARENGTAEHVCAIAHIVRCSLCAEIAGGIYGSSKLNDKGLHKRASRLNPVLIGGEKLEGV